MVSKIIVANSDPMESEQIQKHLSAGGFLVLVAQDGKQAGELTFKHNPDLIVADMNLALVSSFDFCKSVKSNPETKDVPIIIVNVKESMQDSFLFLGIRDFLPKPLDMVELENKIKSRLKVAHTMQTHRTKILFHCVKPVAMTAARILIESVTQWQSKFVMTGKELLSFAQKFIPEVIVVDLFMNDMPVDEVVTALKQLPELAGVEILTYYSPFSGAADSISVAAKMIEVQYLKRITTEAGAREYLGPFNPDNFMGLFLEYRKDS